MKAVPIKEKEYEGNAPRREKKQRWAKIKESKGKEGEKRRQTHRRNGITVAGASDSAISGNDRKKGRSFARTKRMVEKWSAKKNES